MASFLAATFALVDESEQQALIDSGIAQEDSAFGAELVALGSRTSAAWTAKKIGIGHECLPRGRKNDRIRDVVGIHKTAELKRWEV